MEKNNHIPASKTCLLINDYEFDRLLIEEVLEPTGVKICYASPDDMQNLISYKRVDIAIIDMQESSPVQLDTLLQKIKHEYNCPVIGLTDYSYFPSQYSNITVILPKIEIVPNLAETIVHCLKDSVR